MKTVTLNRFDGGIADPRETSTNMCTSVRNFYPQKTKLTPYRDTVTETLDTGVLTDQKLTCVARLNYNPTSYTTDTTQIMALGQAGASDANPKFYQKSTINSVTASFQAATTGEDTTGTVIPNSLIGYKGKFYCLKNTSNSTYLVEYNRLTTTLTEIGVIGASPTSINNVDGVVPQMIIHPKDNKLYIASGSTVKYYDGTTLSSAVTFSTEHNITAMTHQGANVVLGMTSKSGVGSVLGLWSGSTTSAELVDVVDFGSDTLIVLENLSDVVIGVSALSIGGSLDVGIQNVVTIRAYSGGQAVAIKKIESVGSLGSRVYPFKAKKNSTFYFPMSVYLNGTRVHQIWAIYKNESGLWCVNPDRKVSNDTELTSLTITGFSMIGDYFWTAFSDGQFRRTLDTATYTTTSIYETLINPSMEIGDRTKKKLLKSVSCAKAHNSGNIGQVVVKYSVDGGQNWATIGTLASAGGNVFKATNESSGKPFEQAYDYIFRIESTLGAEIVEFKYAYEVVNELI